MNHKKIDGPNIFYIKGSIKAPSPQLMHKEHSVIYTLYNQKRFISHMIVKYSTLQMQEVATSRIGSDKLIIQTSQEC